MSLLLQLMICCGVSVTYLVGAVISWRPLAVIGNSLQLCSPFLHLSFRRMRGILGCFNIISGMLASILQLLGLLFIPESPRWLVSWMKIFGKCKFTVLFCFFSFVFVSRCVMDNILKKTHWFNWNNFNINMNWIFWNITLSVILLSATTV